MSRRLFAILLAANLIVLLWGMREPRPSGDGWVSPDDSVATSLVLLEERPELPTPSQPETAPFSGTAPASPKAAGRCQCAGPFEDPAAAGNFAAQLHRLGIDVEVETAPATAVEGYWLMYPAADMARARRNLRRLQALGLTDLWLFERGPWRGAVSLGLYSEWSRAEAVADRLRAQGIDVAVLPRHRRVTVFWVRLRREPFPGWLSGLASGLGGRDCRHLDESVAPIRPEAVLSVSEGSSSPRL